MVEEIFGFKEISLLVLVCFLLFKAVDGIAVNWYGKPLWVHFYLFKKTLTSSQKRILRNEFPFYRRLNNKAQGYFEHRLANFIENKTFIGRDDLVVTERQKVLIAATASMLTFGMRKYQLPIIEKILLYPDVFYSTINKDYHKGEFNPKFKALVLSWKHFEEGYSTSEDRINLGIHEFTHAIHFNSLRYKGSSGKLFLNGFNDVQRLLQNKHIKDDLRESGYFREYAFTNKFEFLAVLLESFIESPVEFKQRFPLVYKNIQQMFNFRFAGY